MQYSYSRRCFSSGWPRRNSQLTVKRNKRAFPRVVFDATFSFACEYSGYVQT